MRKIGIIGIVCLLLVSNACSTKGETEFSLKDEHYQQILERQKAGIEAEPLSTADLSETMTGEDFEKLGDAHFQQGDLQMAKVQYTKVLNMDPERIPARYKLAVIFLKKERPQAAYKSFHEILDYNLNFAPAYEGMGRALLKMEKDMEAEREFQAALLYDPELWTSTNFLGIVADRRNAHKEAIQMYEVALTQKENHPSILNNLGMAFYLDQQYENSVRTFQQALRAGANNGKTSNNLGLALTKLGHYDLAYDAYTRGMDPSKAYNNLGVAFLEERQYVRASLCFEEAMESQATFYEKASENLSLSKRMLRKLPMIQQQTLIRQDRACL